MSPAKCEAFWSYLSLRSVLQGDKMKTKCIKEKVIYIMFRHFACFLQQKCFVIFTKSVSRHNPVSAVWKKVFSWFGFYSDIVSFETLYWLFSQIEKWRNPGAKVQVAKQSVHYTAVVMDLKKKEKAVKETEI